MTAKTLASRRLLLAFAAAALAGAGATPAVAGQVGRQEVPLSPVYVAQWGFQANRTIDIEVTNATIDPVLHVQNMDDPNGGFVGGNDDCTSADFTRSCVSLPAVSTPRNLAIVVRSYAGLGAGAPAGQGRLIIRSGGVLMSDSNITFAGEKRSFTFPIPAGAMFAGAGIQKRSYNLVLLAIGLPSSAVAYASGPIPRIKVPPQGAYDVVFGYSALSPGSPGIFMWDEDNGTLDGDRDGLSSTFEATLNLSDSNADFDADGISDGEEVLGRKGSADVAYPTFGADPRVQDVFVEADWNDCTHAGCGGNRDFYRMTGSQAESLVSIFRGPTSGPVKLAVHVDLGVVNPAPAGDPSLLRWGHWGGANNRRVTTYECNSRTNNRDQWHLGVLYVKGSAGLGTCFLTPPDDRTPAHELGHNLGLDHGGITASGVANTKVIYASIMNYLYQGTAGVMFSTGSFMGVSFNPYSVNETTWKGSNTTGNLQLIRNLGYKVEGNAVDWNQDNEIQSSPVRGKVNPREESGRLRENGYPDTGLGSNETDPSLNWLASGSNARLYMISRRTTDNALMARHSTNVESACNQLTTQTTRVPCASWSTAGVVPSSVAAKHAAGLADYQDGSTRRLMVVYPAVSDGRLRAQSAAFNSTGSTVTWAAPTTLGTAAVDGAVSAIYDTSANRVDVYAPSGGRLKRWSFNVATRTWDMNAVDQLFSDGSAIAPKAGVGLASGYYRNNATRRYLMMVPYANDKFVDVAIRSTTANRWDKLPGITLKTDSRPGCAYRPFSNAAVTDGRFMCIVKDTTWNPANNKPALAQTEGNDPSGTATFRRLNVWQWALYYGQYDGAATSAMTLTYDPARDTNMRGAWTPGDKIWFQPVADGSLNRPFTDQDDYDLMKKNVACSITFQGCQRCSALASNGTCATWVAGTPQ